jgi:hypothetical protein
MREMTGNELWRSEYDRRCVSAPVNPRDTVAHFRDFLRVPDICIAKVHSFVSL